MELFLWYTGGLVLIAALCVGMQLILKMRELDTAGGSGGEMQGTDRYRPMLRLLSEEDLALLPAHSQLRKNLRALRRRIFRGYLRCLTRDYARLLADVRLAMVRSGVDRPDLARALAKNRMRFAVAICKIECRLALHAAGIGRVEIAGLVDALDLLRHQVSGLTAAAQAA